MPQQSERINKSNEAAKTAPRSIKTEEMTLSEKCPILTALIGNSSSIDRNQEKADEKSRKRKFSVKNQLAETVRSEKIQKIIYGKIRKVICVICFNWVCLRNRKNHIETHIGYRPFKCSQCDYSRKREIFVKNHIKYHHSNIKNAFCIRESNEEQEKKIVELADECLVRTREIYDVLKNISKNNFDVLEGLPTFEKLQKLEKEEIENDAKRIKIEV